jgi:hypothetical protein
MAKTRKSAGTLRREASAFKQWNMYLHSDQIKAFNDLVDSINKKAAPAKVDKTVLAREAINLLLVKYGKKAVNRG